MKGNIQFPSTQRAMQFGAHLASYVNAESLSAYHCAVRIYRLSRAGKTDIQVKAGLKNLRRHFGRDVYEAATSLVSRDGNAGWLVAYEDGLIEVDDLDLKFPTRPHTVNAGDPIIRDGFWVKFERHGVSIESSSNWKRSHASDMANAIDAATLTWHWEEGESGMLLDGNDAIRLWGGSRNPTGAVAA